MELNSITTQSIWSDRSIGAHVRTHKILFSIIHIRIDNKYVLISMFINRSIMCTEYARITYETYEINTNISANEQIIKYWIVVNHLPAFAKSAKMLWVAAGFSLIAGSLGAFNNFCKIWTTIEWNHNQDMLGSFHFIC